jgi:hypothetical protein
MSEDVLNHIKELPFTTSQLDLYGIYGSGSVNFVYLSGDKLYTAYNRTLYVFLMSDITSSIAAYSLRHWCYSAMISDNRLYLGGHCYLKIFILTKSVIQPLTPVTEIATKDDVYKIMRVGH